MIKLFVFACLFLFFGLVLSGGDHDPLNKLTLAFPGAEGAGKFTVGGRSGQVYIVTNLNDSGEGSLRRGVQLKGARTIVFAVSGTIQLERPIFINNDSITIAGQTAPGQGICLKGHGFSIRANEVIIRYLRVRPGDIMKTAQDAVSSIGNRNVIIDHCSMSWGIDEVLSAYNVENLTVQWSMITESLNDSYHHKGEHGYGGIWGGNKATFHHNLLAHHKSRNPRFQGGRSLAEGQQELVEMVNNVVYNWKETAAYGGEAGNHNIVSNYFKPGPATLSDEKDIFLEPYSPPGKFYLHGNFIHGNDIVTANNTKGVKTRRIPLKDIIVQEPFKVSCYKAIDAKAAFMAVLKYAGASLHRDTVDERIVNEVREGSFTFGSKGIINSQEEVGGWPHLASGEAPLDSDSDGMPDDWEKTSGLDPKNDNDSRGFDLCKQFTNLEMYINSIVKR